MNETLKKLTDRRYIVATCRWSFLTDVSKVVKSIDDVSAALKYARIALEYDAELQQLDAAIKRIEVESSIQSDK